jgi:hypothetical protein
MSFWFTPNRLINSFLQTSLTAASQGARQVSIVILTKAHIKLTRTGYAHPVTAFTKIMCHWRDKA